MDPGKKNTWATLWIGRKPEKCFHVPFDIRSDWFSTLSGIRFIHALFDECELTTGDLLVIERFTYRGRGGGHARMAEYMHALIETVCVLATLRGIETVKVIASAHKNSYNKYHRHLYPVATIEKIAMEYGHVRPRLKKVEYNEHCQDSITVGWYIILRQAGKLKSPKKPRKK